jgi:tRNA modification GTPase
MQQADSTTVALLTAPGRGAVAVVSVRGRRAVEWVATHFRSRSGRSLAELSINQVAFGYWLHESGTEEVVVVRRDAETVEIHTHGGTVAPELVLAALQRHGASRIDAAQHLLQDAGNPWRAAAVQALTLAGTVRAADRLLVNADDRLVQHVDTICAAIESGECAAANRQLAELLGSYDFGRRLVEGWQVVIAGPPNVGKSSLLNRLLGYRRSIVFDLPGTTRDIVSSQTAIGGWPVRISDTAGIRAAEGEIERMGVARASHAIRAADLTIWVSDLSQPWTADVERTWRSNGRSIHVANKADLADDRSFRPPGLRVSLLRDPDIDGVVRAIEAQLESDSLASGTPFLVCHWQVSAVTAAAAALVAGNREEALRSLREPITDHRLAASGPPKSTEKDGDHRPRAALA